MIKPSTYYEVLEIVEAYRDAGKSPVSIRKISDSSTLTIWDVRREVKRLKVDGLVDSCRKGVFLKTPTPLPYLRSLDNERT